MSKQKGTLIEYSHLGNKRLQLTRQSTYYRNQVTSLSVKLKYQMNMISKIFSHTLLYGCSQRRIFFYCFFCILPNCNHWTIKYDDKTYRFFFFLVFPEPYLYTSIFYGVHGSLNFCLDMSNGSLFLPLTLNNTIGKFILWTYNWLSPFPCLSKKNLK